MTTTEITISNQTSGALVGADLASVGRIADQVASEHTFTEYQSRKAANTTRRQVADLALFADYLSDAGVIAGDLARDPDAWRGMSWGLVAGFVKWQLSAGYAVASINVRLSTVKTYARLALAAGTIDAQTYHMIKTVKGFDRKEGKRADEDREEAGTPTRAGEKKADPVKLTKAQAHKLKAQPGDTGQGRRDALLMCLLLDHGLRVSEVAGLTVADFDLPAGTLRFYRPKVDKTQTHKLTPDTLAAARAYFENDALAAGPLMRQSRKDGRLHDAGMSTRRLTERVRVLGAALGIHGLSAHDARHYWATTAARNGTAIDRLMDAGGWTSPAMPLHYVESAAIANQGVKLEGE